MKRTPNTIDSAEPTVMSRLRSTRSMIGGALMLLMASSCAYRAPEISHLPTKAAPTEVRSSASQYFSKLKAIVLQSLTTKPELGHVHLQQAASYIASIKLSLTPADQDDLNKVVRLLVDSELDKSWNRPASQSGHLQEAEGYFRRLEESLR